MRRVVLLGNPGTKRTQYLEKAVLTEGIELTLLDWKGWKRQLPDGTCFLKIDPPVWDSCSLGDLEHLAGAYQKELAVLNRLVKERQTECLNQPSAIAVLLNKYSCKEQLQRAGLPVTDLLKGASFLRDTEQLLETMRRQHVHQVFVKPACGSGAAGVSALRIQPKTGRMSLYTCAVCEQEDKLINTKRLYQITEEEKIRRMLDALLCLPCVVEHWCTKAAYQGYAYDLRVVLQGGRIDYALARLSRGPITNLQLNNHPLPIGELGLSLQVREQIEALCQQAAGCFPGLWSVGIDLLLGRRSLEPKIIEMNAQGDLIYQDIYQENIIYRRQAERMKRWLSV